MLLFSKYITSAELCSFWSELKISIVPLHVKIGCFGLDVKNIPNYQIQTSKHIITKALPTSIQIFILPSVTAFLNIYLQARKHFENAHAQVS